MIRKLRESEAEPEIIDTNVNFNDEYEFSGIKNYISYEFNKPHHMVLSIGLRFTRKFATKHKHRLFGKPQGYGDNFVPIDEKELYFRFQKYFIPTLREHIKTKEIPNFIKSVFFTVPIVETLPDGSSIVEFISEKEVEKLIPNEIELTIKFLKEKLKNIFNEIEDILGASFYEAFWIGNPKSENARILSTLPVKTHAGTENKFINDIWEGPSGDVDLEEFVRRVEPLRSNKIEKAIGAGAYGVVYLLSNGNVLKLYKSGIGTHDSKTGEQISDQVKYEKMKDRQFSGKASVHEPAIYSTGTVGKISYVEMGKIIPINVWLAKYHSRYAQGIVYNALENLRKLFQEKQDQKLNINKDTLAIAFDELVPALPKEEKFLKKILYNLLVSLIKYRKGFDVIDLHLGNVGVIEKDLNPAVNVHFVFFDI